MRDTIIYIAIGLILALMFGQALFKNCAVDANRGKIFSLGSGARVTCHSGGKVIFEGCSTGKAISESTSDGYYFKEKITGRFVEVSGDCVIDYEAMCPVKKTTKETP